MQSPSHPSTRPEKRGWGLRVAVIAMIANILALIPAYLSLSRQVASMRQNVQAVENRLNSLAAASQFFITSPVDCANVGFTELVRGVTPFSDVNHYVVVTPLDDGSDWIQAGTVTVSGASWAGRATFGTGKSEIGKRFLVRTLVTKTVLSPGRIEHAPGDAIFTSPVAVTRTK